MTGDYSVSVYITGVPPFYINGVTTSNNYYLSQPIESGEPYYLQIYDSSPCNALVPVILAGTFHCGPLCLSQTGAMNPELLEICADQIAAPTPVSGYTVAPGDTFEYVLHTAADTILGQVLMRNTSGQFAFDEAILDIDQTYYISLIIGPPGLNGGVDTGSPCLKVANGQPLQFKALPQLTLTGDSLLSCHQPQAALQWSSDIPINTATWTGPEVQGSSAASLMVSTPGTYTVQVWTAAGCTSSATALLSADFSEPLPAPSLQLVAPACFGESNGSITIGEMNSGTPPYDYTISGQPIMENLLSGLSAGSYPLVVVDANGCRFDTLLQISEPPPVAVELGEDLYIAIGERITIKAISTISPFAITWDSNAGEKWENTLSIEVQPLTTTTYTILIADENGCEAGDDITVFVKNNVDIYIPNAFSPNNDGINDRFTLFGKAGQIENIVELLIFDRWGDLVFRKNNFAPNDEMLGWDGSARGKAQSQGVHVYYAVVELAGGRQVKLQGEVVVVR